MHNCIHAPLLHGKKLTTEKENLFFEHAIQYLRIELNVDKIEQGDVLGFTKYKPNNAPSCKYGTYQLNLKNQTPESLLKNFNAKYARDVRNAEKHNLYIKSGIELIEDFYSVYQLTSKHTGMYTDTKGFFQNAVTHFGAKNCSFVVAYEGETPIGAFFTLKTPYKWCITHTGTNRNSNIHGAIRWLHYQNILFALEQNVHYYDFMGVRINSNNQKLKGVFDFKKGFGGELDEGYLWKLTLRPFHIMPYYIMHKIKNILSGNKFTDIIDQEK